MKYSQEQRAIADTYNTRAMAEINNPEKFDSIMKEFDELKIKWDEQDVRG